MYQQINESLTGKLANVVKRLTDNAFIPFDPANTDYITFKKDLEEGVELQDADGKKMTKTKVTAFLKTLP